MHKLFYSLLLLILAGCSNNPKKEIKSALPIENFDHFPSLSFLNIPWGDSIEKVKIKLSKAGFSRIHERAYSNKTKRIEFLFKEESSTLESFKLFFFGEENSQQNLALLELLKKHSISAKKNTDFSIYEIKVSTLKYCVAVFVQPKYTRCEFNLKQFSY